MLRFSTLLLVGLLLVGWGLFPPVLGAQPQVSIHRVPAPAAPVSVFGGGRIPVAVRLIGIHSCERVVARLYQSALMLQAPLSEWMPVHCKSTSSGLAPGAVRAHIDVAVPPVDAEIALELRFATCARSGESCKVFGHVSVFALPADLLSPLGQWAGDHVLQVHDSNGRLSEFLDTHEIDYLSVGSILPHDTKVVSLVVEDDQLSPAVLADYQRAGAVVLFRTTPHPVPLVVQRDTPAGRLVDVRLPVLSRLASDPGAAKLFLDLFYMTQSREPQP